MKTELKIYNLKKLAYNGELHDIINIMDNTVGSLSGLEQSIIIGSVLGDGYLRIMPNRSDAFLEINHSIKAKDYVDFKYNSLKRICKSKPRERKNNNDRVAYRFYTKQHPEITKIYEDFYENSRKIIPKNLKLNPVILAIWYMDDGSKSRDTDIYLNTQNFSLNDQNTLVVALRKMGIKSRLNKDKKYFRIRILKESINFFMELITPYICESMRYKTLMTP